MQYGQSVSRAGCVNKPDFRFRVSYAYGAVVQLPHRLSLLNLIDHGGCNMSALRMLERHRINRYSR